MSSSLSPALAVAGPISGKFLDRNPALCQRIGPVIAPTFRLARRSANALRAGYAVRKWDELRSCSLIIVSASAQRLQPLIREMQDSGLRWTGRVVLLTDSLFDSSALSPLREMGAHVGSLIPAGLPEREEYLVEGDPAGVRRVKHVLQQAGLRVHAVSRSTRVVYAATAALTSHLTLALMDAMMVHLRKGGVERALARRILERSVSESIRQFARGGRRPPRQRISKARQLELIQLIGQLREEDAPLADYLVGALEGALRMAGQDAEWAARELRDGQAGSARRRTVTVL
jgi:CheY-like chemotaxis protein